MVPPRGFEPLISALKGRRPRPLDDGGEDAGRPIEPAHWDYARNDRLPESTARRLSRARQAKSPREIPSGLVGSGSWIRTNDLRVMSPTSYHCSIPRRFVVSYSKLTRSGSREEVKGKDLAPAYCPTQLPTQYRRRWGVSRPCSGRERVGPPRSSHQDPVPPDWLSLAASRTHQRHRSEADGHARAQGQGGEKERRSCRPGVVHESK
jgi:hypothetical protein